MEAPDGFTVIETGLYLAGSALEYSIPFLKTLGLKLVVVLDSGKASKQLVEFAHQNNIKIHEFTIESWRPASDKNHSTHVVKIISECLRFAVDVRNYPLLFIGSTILAGTIRKLENWSLFAVLNEYNSCSENAPARVFPFGSVFLEFVQFSFKPTQHAQTNRPFLVEVILPEKQFRPDWVHRFHIGEDI